MVCVCNIKYINSISALGQSLSFNPKYTHITQAITLKVQPTHCVAMLAFDNIDTLIIAKANPIQRQPLIFLNDLIFIE